MGGAGCRWKYPRTAHLPWSEAATIDDRCMSDLAGLAGVEVVVTEKMDGENSTIYADGFVHARSIDSARHESRDWLRAQAAMWTGWLPEDGRLCGENVYAEHSIGYNNLDSWFLLFGIWQSGWCWSWDATVGWCERAGAVMVPVLWRGRFPDSPLVAERLLERVWSDQRDPSVSEGYVVRPTAGFDVAGFGRLVGKRVRAGHVQTGDHWMFRPVVRNGLAG